MVIDIDVFVPLLSQFKIRDNLYNTYNRRIITLRFDTFFTSNSYIDAMKKMLNIDNGIYFGSMLSSNSFSYS